LGEWTVVGGQGRGRRGKLGGGDTVVSGVPHDVTGLPGIPGPVGGILFIGSVCKPVPVTLGVWVNHSLQSYHLHTWVYLQSLYITRSPYLWASTSHGLHTSEPLHHVVSIPL